MSLINELVSTIEISAGVPSPKHNGGGAGGAGGAGGGGGFARADDNNENENDYAAAGQSTTDAHTEVCRSRSAVELAVSM